MAVEASDKRPLQILLCTPCSRGFVRQEYSACLLTQFFNHPDRLANQQRYQLAIYQIKGYSGLGKDRGVLASYALRHRFDKIFFVDDDMEWRWDQCKTLFDSDKPIIAGVAPLKQFPAPMNFTPLDEDKDCFELDSGIRTFEGMLRLVAKYGNVAEVPVKAIGTAFMVIDTKVLYKMVELGAEPFKYMDYQSNKEVKCWDFFPSGPLNGDYYGEDFGFCFKAKEAGFPIYMNAGVHVNHIGAHTYRVDGKLY